MSTVVATSSGGSANPNTQPPLTGAAQIAEDSLRIGRKAFTWAFFGALVFMTVLILATVVVMIIVAVGGDQNLDKSLVARLLQITYGMVIGSACLFLGVILAWFGISASFAVSAEGGASTKLTLSSASPGIALICGGLILVGITLFRPINYFEKDEGVQHLQQPTVPAPIQ